MLCDNCRSSNVANAKFCTVCGAPLQPQPPVRGQRQEPDSQPDNKFLYDDGFTTRQPPPEHHPQAPGSRSTPRQQAVETPVRRSPGAVVCYLISGILALVCAALPLLPQFWMWGVVGGKTYNVPEVAVILTGGGSVFEGGATNVTAGVLILVLFVLLLLFYLLWAVFSFVRIGAAGAVGLTGSILFAGAGLYWLLYLMDLVKLGSSYFCSGEGVSADWLTPPPYLMIALGVAGIFFSSVQLSLRGRVR